MKLKKFSYKKVISTNLTAIRLIRVGNSSGFVTSEIQSKGRGQRGNKWISKNGNIFISVFFSINGKISIQDITKKNLVLTVSANGSFYIGTKSFNLDSSQVLEVYLNEISLLDPQPELHLKIDKELLFEDLDKIMKLLQMHGIKKIAFLADPFVE